MDLCSRVYEFFASLVKTRQPSVEKTDLDSSTHDFELTKNLCACSCEKSCPPPCPCSNIAQEEKKNPLDFSELKEKVDEVLHLLEEVSVKDDDEEDNEEVKVKDNKI
jgi:hypothetical protein